MGTYVCPSCKIMNHLPCVNGIPFPDDEIKYELCYTCDRLAGESKGRRNKK